MNSGTHSMQNSEKCQILISSFGSGKDTDPSRARAGSDPCRANLGVGSATRKLWSDPDIDQAQAELERSQGDFFFFPIFQL